MIIIVESWPGVSRGTEREKGCVTRGTEREKGCVLKISHKEHRIWTGGRDVGGVWYRVT